MRAKQVRQSGGWVRGAWLGTMMGLGLLASSGSLAADNEKVRGELTAALQAGWKPSTSGLKSAIAHFEAANSLAPGDVRVPFAMALVFLQNHKPAEAAAQLDLALASHKPLLPIRRVRIYVAVLMKDFSAADREMRALAEQLAGAALEGEDEQPYRDSATFLGAVLEYLSLQAGAAWKSANLAALEENLQTQLQASRNAAFTASRAEVTKQAADLEAKLAVAKGAALEQDKAKNAVIQGKFDAFVAPAKKQLAEATDRELAYRAANEADVAKHEPNAREGLVRINRLANEANARRTRISSLESKIRQVEKENNEKIKKANKDKDKSSPRLESTRSEEQEVARLEREVQILQQEITQIEANPAVKFMRGYLAELQRLKFAIDQANQFLAQMQLQGNRNFKPVPVNESNAATGALKQAFQALSTYVDFSPEAERDRILATYGK